MKRIISVFMISFLALTIGCINFDKSCSVGRGNIALVEIKGMIIEPDELLEDLEKARKSKRVKAVLVRVDSPGGAIAASQEIFRAIKDLKETKPVIVSMGDVAASGGYYVSAGATKIFANEGTVTGSIGVIVELMNAEGFFEMIRLKPQVLKSGKYKDAGSIFRDLTSEEKKLIEDMLAELHVQFKKDIIDSRKVEKSLIDEIADGRIFSGSSAKEYGLVDELGGLLQARDEAAKLGGIKGEPKFVKMRKEKPWWVDIFSEKVSLLSGMSKFAVGNKYFMYKWEL